MSLKVLKNVLIDQKRDADTFHIKQKPITILLTPNHAHTSTYFVLLQKSHLLAVVSSSSLSSISFLLNDLNFTNCFQRKKMVTLHFNTVFSGTYLVEAIIKALVP